MKGCKHPAVAMRSLWQRAGFIFTTYAPTPGSRFRTHIEPDYRMFRCLDWCSRCGAIRLVIDAEAGTVGDWTSPSETVDDIAFVMEFDEQGNPVLKKHQNESEA